jgi:RNA polymerase subunit RPABC4/transcription elongation factor Spt4
LNVEAAPAAKPNSFAAGEMVACDACLRANPPTRSSCIYCGGALATRAIENEASGASATEQQSVAPAGGYYLILPADQLERISESSLPQVADLLQVKPTELQNALSGGGPIPLFLAKTAEQSKKLAEDMRALGLDVGNVPEADLTANATFRKVRALELSDDSLTGLSVSSSDRFTVNWSEIILIVSGRLIVNRVEVAEKRRRAGQKPSDTREFSSDETVLDIYVRSDTNAWRIFVNSFDFSCLGSSKGLTAFENVNRLMKIFRERAPNLQVYESYPRLRPILANVWPPEKKTRNAQLRKDGVGKLDVSTVITTDNETQFNNYSRLLQHLRLREFAIA